MKKKNIFIRIFCCLLISCFGLMSISCGFSLDELIEIGKDLVGWDEDDPSSGDNKEDDPSSGNDPGIEEALPPDLYGSKVLYRPDNYDYDYGSGGADGSGEGVNDYYGQYAWGILSYLYNIFGISSVTYTSQNNPEFDLENLPYLYDSIRYQVDSAGMVTHSATIDAEGNLTIDEDNKDFEKYYIIGANKNVCWNWSFAPNIDNLSALLYNDYSFMTSYENSNYIYNTYLNIKDQDGDFQSYISDSVYGQPIYQQNYSSIYLGAINAIDYDNYSDFVKTLEYVIYTYAVDLEPSQVYVTQTNEYPYYRITIGTYESVDSALETAKARFKTLGTYVGLVSRQITKIQNWVLENVIGEDALRDDSFMTYQTNTDGQAYLQVTHPDGSITYQLAPECTASTDDLGRNYETTVRNVINAVCNDVSIGKDEGSDVTIDDRFLASNIMEYAGSTFKIEDDKNFPVYDPNNEEHQYAIRPLEYQSVVLMFKQETYVDGLWIALKYDADLDGNADLETEDAVYDWNRYIDIIVDLNYYKHATNTRRIIQSKKVRVYDGPFEIDYIYGYKGDTIGGGDGVNAPRDHCSGVVFDDIGYLHVGVFNTNIGNGILKTDVGRNDYKGNPLVSKEPLILVGTNNIRKYYEIVEPGSTSLDQEALQDGYTYTSGRLNPAMFSGSDGCDYLEITYKVIKKAGDMTTNYKFYTGLKYLDNEDSPVP